MRRLFLLAFITASVACAETDASQAADAGLKLAFPVDCTLGKTCWIQHYVDRSPSATARDYMCGTLTYGGHNGTDIRITDMAAERAGVNVLAAADGRVLRLREGMADVSVRSTGLEAVRDQECGNGVVIDNGGGWQTQYCHMAKGSIVVKPGDIVKSGAPLGHVGLSGETEFPHLHFSVRRDGVTIDPFAPDPPAAGLCGSGVSRWARTPVYTPRAVINASFTSHPVDMAAIEQGDITPPDMSAPYIVAYVRVIGLKAGDQPTLSFQGPDGSVLAATPPTTLAMNSDQRFVMIGRRRPSQGWAGGVYRARYIVRAGGRDVLEHDFEITLNSRAPAPKASIPGPAGGASDSTRFSRPASPSR